MNKTDLVNAISAKTGLSKADAKSALDAFVSIVSEQLVAGDKVSLVGFGTFSVVEKAARAGYNPLTKEPIAIAARKAVKFKAGAELDANVK